MGIEYSPSRRQKMRKRAQAARNAQTWGGPVTVKRLDDVPVEDRMWRQCPNCGNVGHLFPDGVCGSCVYELLASEDQEQDKGDDSR